MSGLFEAYEESFSNQQKQIQELRRQLSAQHILCEECEYRGADPYTRKYQCTTCKTLFCEEQLPYTYEPTTDTVLARCDHCGDTSFQIIRVEANSDE